MIDQLATAFPKNSVVGKNSNKHIDAHKKLTYNDMYRDVALDLLEEH